MEQQMKNHNDELKKMNEEMNLYKNYDMVEIKKQKNLVIFLVWIIILIIGITIHFIC